MFFRKVFEWIKKNLLRCLIFFFGIGIIVYVLFLSGAGMPKSINSTKDLYSLLSPSLIFLVSTAIKLFAAFWIFVITISIINWNRISEHGIKIFGIEINQKFNRQELDNALFGVEIVRKQVKLLSNLQDHIFKFSVSSFKKLILESDSVPDKVRDIIKNILMRAYQSNFPKVEISVLPIETKTINDLEPRIYAPVQMLIDKDETDLIHIEYDNLGIGIHRSYEGLETIIIIDTSKEDYEISLAEIELASNLFLSIANTIAD